MCDYSVHVLICLLSLGVVVGPTSFTCTVVVIPVHDFEMNWFVRMEVIFWQVILLLQSYNAYTNCYTSYCSRGELKVA